LTQLLPIQANINTQKNRIFFLKGGNGKQPRFERAKLWKPQEKDKFGTQIQKEQKSSVTTTQHRRAFR
jgi:hypothetical protein